MSDYKRITMREFAGVTGDNIYNRLAELEDKIESGELVDRNEYKHRAEVAERALATVCEEVLHARYPVEYVTVSVVEDLSNSH